MKLDERYENENLARSKLISHDSTGTIDQLLMADRKKIGERSGQDRAEDERLRILKGQKLVDKDHPLQDAPLTDILPFLRRCQCKKR